jgi:hypothetical protein
LDSKLNKLILDTYYKEWQIFDKTLKN